MNITVWCILKFKGLPKFMGKGNCYNNLIIEFEEIDQ